MWLAALVIGAWAAYLTLWTSMGSSDSHDNAWLITSICLASWATAIGLLLDRPWAGKLVYLLVAVDVAWVGFQFLASDSPLLPYPDTLSNVIAYIPVTVFLMINTFLIVAMRRHFSSRAQL